MQHLKEYVNPEGIPTPIEIKSRTAWNWLRKLGFEYKDVKKDVFIDGHERPDVVKDRQKILKVIKELEPYLVEFNEDGTIKANEYPSYCAIEGANRQPVIVITHDESTSIANDDLRRTWTRKGTVFYDQKGEDKASWLPNFCFRLDVLIYLLYLRLNVTDLDCITRLLIKRLSLLRHFILDTHFYSYSIMLLANLFIHRMRYAQQT